MNSEVKERKLTRSLEQGIRNGLVDLVPRSKKALRMQALALSDKQVPFIYSPQVRKRFEAVEVIFGCGDLAYNYLEYVYNALDVPLFFVRGNHDKVVEYSHHSQRTAPAGGVDLHRRVVNIRGLLLAGVEGSLRYRQGPFQYTQAEMWAHVLHLAPTLLANRFLYGRTLDFFITHAPPAGIHDQPDLPHQGIRAFNWLIKVFQPAVHLHGHIHLYLPDTVQETQLGSTRVLNAYGYREVTLERAFNREPSILSRPESELDS